MRRFFGSLSRAEPAAADTAWVEGILGPGELRLWRRMSAADRRHAAGVARRVDSDLGGTPDTRRPALAAALLHDVGKVDAGLGTLGRVGATLIGLAGSRARAAELARRRGPLGRVGRYLDHPAIGAALLEEAGSDPLTVAWTAEHHLDPERWSVPSSVASALHRADDD